MTTIPISSIDSSHRARRDYGDLSGLKNSLSRLGSLHPIVLSKKADNTGYDLIAGGRRLKALQELNVKELYHGSVLTPGKLGFLFSDEVPESLRQSAELDENLHRLQTSWMEDVLLVADVHDTKRREMGTKEWGVRETASFLGGTYNKDSVSLAIRLSKMIRSGSEEFAACKTFSDALGVLAKLKGDSALAELQKRAAARMESIPGGMPGQESYTFLDSLNIELTGKSETPTVTPASPSTPTITVPLSSMFFCADMQTHPWPKVDHIVTDIPYAIDTNNMDAMLVQDVKDEHDVVQNIGLMRTFLNLAFNALKPGGFCVFFYDLDHHEKLQSWAVSTGFKVQAWPFIACKSSACRNGAPAYNTTKNFETAMFLRKDSNAVLRKPISSSYGVYNFALERDIYNHPFAKPFALWKDIFEMITFSGQSVLDPYCGEMSSCRAAANCGLIPFGIELKEQHFNRGLQHMREIYTTIHGKNTNFV